MNSGIYLDYQATTPIDPVVLDVMVDAYNSNFANPSSRHYNGLQAEAAVDEARQRIASYLCVAPSSLIFTSGATEANNLALKGITRSFGSGHIISVVTEHKSVLAPLERLRMEGYSVTLLPVSRDGSLDLNQLRDAIRADTILGSFMLVNNEIGTKLPLQEISGILHEHGVLVHCDATQALTNLRVHPRTLGIDILSASGHKIYGPKGIGFLYVDFGSVTQSRLLPEQEGGDQERGFRSGTPNVPAIAGIAKAIDVLDSSLESDIQENQAKRAAFVTNLPKSLSFRINGPEKDFTPSNLSLTFERLKAAKILADLDDVMIGTGSACTSNSGNQSHVLKAIGLNTEEIASTVRVSFGRFTGITEVAHAAQSFERLLL